MLVSPLGVADVEKRLTVHVAAEVFAEDVHDPVADVWAAVAVVGLSLIHI